MIYVQSFGLWTENDSPHSHPLPLSVDGGHLRLFACACRRGFLTYTQNAPTQVAEPFEDSSNWQLDPAFTGESRGRSSGGGGGGSQATEGADGAADGAWQQAAYTLAIGEMEDDGVGEETAAKAAAFFDVSLDSPRVSAKGGAAAAASPPAAGRSSGSSGGGRGTAAGSGGRPVSSIRDPGSSGGGDVATSREPTAAEMWMYGSVDSGSGAQRIE